MRSSVQVRLSAPEKLSKQAVFFERTACYFLRKNMLWRLFGDYGAKKFIQQVSATEESDQMAGTNACQMTEN